MANRDISLSICGVVVGVLMGAGSVLYVQDIALNASSTDDALSLRPDIYDIDMDTRNTRERNLKRPSDTSGAKTIKKMQDEADVTDVSDEITDCDIAEAVIAQFDASFRAGIANEAKNSYAYKLHNDSIKSARATYCSGVPMRKAAPAQNDADVEQSSTKKVTNKCYMFEKGSTRYTKCMGAKNQGESWDNQ